MLVDWLRCLALSCRMVGTLQSRFPVSEPTGLTLVNSEHYAEAPRFSAGVSHMLNNDNHESQIIGVPRKICWHFPRIIIE